MAQRAGTTAAEATEGTAATAVAVVAATATVEATVEAGCEVAVGAIAMEMVVMAMVATA